MEFVGETMPLSMAALPRLARGVARDAPACRSGLGLTWPGFPGNLQPLLSFGAQSPNSRQLFGQEDGLSRDMPLKGLGIMLYIPVQL